MDDVRGLVLLVSGGVAVVVGVASVVTTFAMIPFWKRHNACVCVSCGNLQNDNGMVQSQTDTHK